MFLFLLLSDLQAGDIRRVKRAMEKGDYVKTEELILKYLEHADSRPGIKYLYSVLFLTPEFHRHTIDSSAIFIRQALAEFDTAEEDVLEEMAEEGIDQETLTDHLSRITELAFDRAEKQSTISRWRAFIKAYPEAVQNPLAIDRLDSLAFDAVDKKSEMSLREFLQTYPKSKFNSEIRNILDRLLVDQYWKSKSQNDLEKFIVENPESAHLEKALGHLLKLWTRSGDADAFLTFIQKYVNSIATTKAVNFLYHLDKESGFKDFSDYADFHSSADSLRRVRENESMFQVAIFENTYKLISQKNNVTTTSLTSIDEDILCTGVTTDLIAGSDSNGSLILTKGGIEFLRAQLVKDLGYGFILIQKDAEQHVYHKSGVKVLENVEEAEILNGAFIKAKRNNLALYSFAGIQITEEEYDDIFLEGDFWVFEKEDLFAISSAKEISESFPDRLFLEFKFEEYELIDENLLIGFRGDRECLLKSDGQFLVPWAVQQIYPDETNGYVHDEKGYAFYGPDKFTYYPYLEVNQGFVLRKEAENKWMLFSNERDWFASFSDSVKLISRYCALITGQQPKLIFQNQKTMEIGTDDIPQPLSMASTFTSVRGETSFIVDSTGRVLFSGDFAEIASLNDTLFSVSLDGKYGVVNEAGDELLPIEFDYLNLERGILSCIKNQKIGAYDLSRDIQFAPVFESRVVRFKDLYKVKMHGAKGLVDGSGAEVLPFEYEEIIEWTDTLIWTKQQDRFQLINLNTRQSEMEVTLLRSFAAGNETQMKFYGSAGFGLIAKSGLLLKPIYSDIVWVGNEAQGIIMADQALPEAGFHVVTYFEADGEKIYSQAYSTEDFEKVLCDR